MKRPFAVIGISYITALAVALFFGSDSFFILCAVFLAGFAVCLLSKKSRKFALIFITAFTAVLMLWGYTFAYITPSVSLKGETAEISGVLCELPYKYYDRYYYKIKTNDYTVLVASRYKIKIEPYDTLKATVKFYGETDISRDLYNFSKGITVCASIDNLKPKTVIKNDNKPLYYYALMARKYMSDKINSLLPEREAGFVNALLTGDKYQLKDNEKQILRASGISHIVVISGFHVAVITHLMLGFFMLVTRKRKKLSSALCIVFLLFYMAVTGFHAPVVRADTMQIFILAAKILSKKSDSFNILGFSALLICFINPYAVADVSFIMSFSATFGILLISRKIYLWVWERISTNKLKTLIKSLTDIFAVSLSAYIFVLPATIIFFKQAAVYAVITNLFVSFAVTLLIYTAVFMVMTGLSPLAWTACFFTDYIFNVAEAVANLPFALIATSQEFVPFWLITAVIAGIAMIYLNPNGKTIKYYALITVMSFIILSVSDSLIKKDSIKISVLDAGDGISCVVNCNNRTYLLSSGGSYYKSSALDDYLTDSCVYQIAYMLLLDDKNNCTAFSKRILENYEIETVQVFDENKYTENIKLLLSEINGKIDGSYFYTNNDAEIYAEKQKNCMAVKADFGDLSILLIHGKTDCNNIPKSWLDTDILVINGSIENLGLVNASVTVISDEEHRGNIYLRAYNNGKIQIGRENGWLN